MSCNLRVKELRLNLDLSAKDFAQDIGMSESSLFRIEKGERPVTNRTIKSICARFNVNEDWLRTGKGNMFDGNDVILRLIAELIKEDDVAKNALELIVTLNRAEFVILTDFIRFLKEVPKYK